MQRAFLATSMLAFSAACNDQGSAYIQLDDETVENLFVLSEAPNPSYDNILSVAFEKRGSCVVAKGSADAFTPVFAGEGLDEGYRPLVREDAVVVRGQTLPFGQPVDLQSVFEGTASVRTDTCPSRTLIIPL